MIHQDEETVIGLMLNRPIQPTAEATLSVQNSEQATPRFQIPSEINEPESDSNELSPTDQPTVPSQNAAQQLKALTDSPLHFGGPLSGPVVAVHHSEQYAEAEMGNGVYVAAHRNHLQPLLEDGEEPYRLIVGHLGWKVDQLENEIEAGIWHVLPATVDAVFTEDSTMWHRLIRRATANSMAKWIGVPDQSLSHQVN